MYYPGCLAASKEQTCSNDDGLKVMHSGQHDIASLCSIFGSRLQHYTRAHDLVRQLRDHFSYLLLNEQRSKGSVEELHKRGEEWFICAQ